MKRENTETSTTPKKKAKKSVKISSDVEIKTFSKDESLQPKVNKLKIEKKTKRNRKTKVKSNEEAPTKLEKVAKMIDKMKKKNQTENGQKAETFKQKKYPKKFDNHKKSDSKPQGNVEGEKPDWKKIKQEKKEMKQKRKEQRLQKLYTVHSEVMKLSEKLRLEDLPKDERKEVCDKVHSLLKGSYNQVVHAHDTSRVIQWLLKYSEQTICDEILAELKPSWANMFTSKYAKKCLVSACEHCSKDIQKGILDACQGRIVKILTSSETSRLFEKLLSLYATMEQKNSFKQELYGDLYKSNKDPNIKSLEDVFKQDSVMKMATLSAVKKNLTKIINKQLIASTLVHTVLYEFLSICSPEDRSEMIQLVRDISVQLIESKWGAKAGVICIWHGTNKDRKVIIKSLKEHLKDVFLSEHGHLMLMALIDCVDDTILMKKVLLTEMQSDLKEIVVNEYGRKVVLYLVARRDQKFFHPFEIAYFKQGDGNATSKKSVELREKELLDHVIDGFLKSIKEDVPFWLKNGANQMVAYAILASNHDRDMTEVFEAIVNFIADDSSVLKEEDGKEVPAIEHAGLHVTMKKLLQADSKFREKNGQCSFAKVLVQKLDDALIKRCIECNRGCFLLIVTLENSEHNVAEILKRKVLEVKKELKKQKAKGAAILLKKLE